MEQNGLTKKVVPDGAKRSIYTPTQKCFDLVNTLLALSEWSEKWTPDPNGPRISVRNPKTGKKLRLGLITSDKLEKYAHTAIDINFGNDLKEKLSL